MTDNKSGELAPDAGFSHVGPVRPEEVKRRRANRGMRAAGSIVGMAVGDPLGAPYEFGPSPGVIFEGTEADMVGGGALGWARGEWTDDTSMAMPILRQIAAGRDLREAPVQADVVREWRAWARGAPDVGVQTRRVLGDLGENATAEDARKSALRVHESTGRSGGNGSLMRTAPVGLAFIGDREGRVLTADAARAMSGLTHYDQDTADVSVIWSVAIYHAVLIGSLVINNAVWALPEERRACWSALLD